MSEQSRSVEDKVADLCAAISEAYHKLDRRYLRAPWDYSADPDLWLHGGAAESAEWAKAKQILEGLGFLVSFVSKSDRTGDSYTLIEFPDGEEDGVEAEKN